MDEFQLDKSEEEIALIVDICVSRSENWSEMVDDNENPGVIGRILQEREKDLELAARIGKALLQRNEDLERRNEALEEQATAAGDRVIQLRHELQKKSELLRVFTESEGESSGELRKNSEKTACSHLQRRVRVLEEENAALKVDISQLKAITIVLKEKEEQIVAEFLRKIADARRQTKAVASEVQEKQDECEKKETKIRCLAKEIAEKLKNEHKLKEENAALTAKLRVVQGLQADLTQELQDLQERYGEVLTMLTSAKQELKDAQETQANARFSTSSLADDSLCDSLASELEASDSGYSCHKNPPPYFTPTKTDEESITSTKPKSISDQFGDDSLFDPVESDSEASEKAKCIIRNIEAALATPQFSRGSILGSSTSRLGVPGTPGSKDLEQAIERLGQSEIKKANSLEGLSTPSDSDHQSISSVKQKRTSNRAKLMLVVPVEGSKALAHWKELATPSGIDPRSWQNPPGINVKGGFSSNFQQMPNLRKHFTLSSVIADAKRTSSSTLSSKTSTSSSPNLDATSKPGRGLTERCLGLLNPKGWRNEKSTPLFSRNALTKDLDDLGDALLGSLTGLNLEANSGNGVMTRARLS